MAAIFYFGDTLDLQWIEGEYGAESAAVCVLALPVESGERESA